MTFLLAIRGATFLGAIAACDASSIHTSRRLSLRIPRHETNPWNLPHSHQNHLVHPPPLRARSPERQAQFLMRKRLKGGEQLIHRFIVSALTCERRFVSRQTALIEAQGDRFVGDRQDGGFFRCILGGRCHCCQSQGTKTRQVNG